MNSMEAVVSSLNYLTPSNPDAAIGALSRRVFDVLVRYTALPWPMLEAQCARQGRNARALTPEDLAALAGPLAEAVARFTRPENRSRVAEELLELTREEPPDAPVAGEAVVGESKRGETERGESERGELEAGESEHGE